MRGMAAQTRPYRARHGNPFTLMAILDILEFPDARLRTIAKPVEKVDASVQQLVDDMFETMYAAPGIGLAATQVNVHRRVVVMDISEDGKQPLVLINPEVRVLEGGTREYSEGCLSVPGFHELVTRPENIVVTALDRDGNPFELHPDGLLAAAEYDLGVLMREDPVDLLAGDPYDRARWLAHRTGLDATAIWEWGVVERVSTGLLCTKIGLQPIGRQMLHTADQVAALGQPAGQ